MKRNDFFHGLKASFTFLLSHTFFLKILLFSCRLSLVYTKYVTNRKWEIVLLRYNLLFVKNYCNDSPRIFRKVFPCVKTRTTDAQWSLFSSKSQTFGLGQVIWAGKFWGISGVFGRFISSHFRPSFLVWVHILHWSTIISTKNSAFIFKSQIFRLGFEFGSQRIRDSAIVCPQSVCQDNQGKQWVIKLSTLIFWLFGGLLCRALCYST